MNRDKIFEVVYITGPPATGKSTLVSNLKKRIYPLEVYTYSKLLADYVGEKHGSLFSEDQMREQSAQLITANDVNAVDRHLVDLVNQHRRISHVIIDSHPVTKEQYGYRVTPFSLDLLSSIRPTIICMLFTEPHVVMNRIQSNSQGRPEISAFEADFHNSLQASVAVSYSISLGIPIYFYDSNRSPDDLADEVGDRITSRN